MRVYFVGSHSVGKTSLARHVAGKFGLPMLTETARLVLARYEKTLDEVRRDQDSLDCFQRDVMESQIQVETAQGGNFVSDRALDFLAYAGAKTRFTKDLLPRAQSYIGEQLRQPDAVIFFVRPHREFVVADNVRAKADLDWDEVVKIDAMIEYLLESNGLRYFPVASKLLRDRIRLVDAVIELAMKAEAKHGGAPAAGCGQ